jgi:hypothetical protein
MYSKLQNIKGAIARGVLIGLLLLTAEPPPHRVFY